MDGAVAAFRAMGGALGLAGNRENFRLPLLFLDRLDRLARLRAMPELPRPKRRLVDHALYSTYWDCVQLGLRADARQVLGLPPD